MLFIKHFLSYFGFLVTKIQFNKLTEIDELKEQIKQLNKEKAVQEKLTSELLKKVKRLGGRE